MQVTVILSTILISVILAILLLPVFICYEVYKKLDWKKIRQLYKIWIGKL